MSDELSVVLRELAAEQEARPVLTGAEVRGRCGAPGAPSDGRHAGRGCGGPRPVGCALTLDLTGKENGRQLPGAAAPAVPSRSQSAPPSPSAASAAVSTSVSAVPSHRHARPRQARPARRGRVMPLTADSANSPVFVGPLTVYGKHGTKVRPSPRRPTESALYAEVTLAVELRDADDKPVYVGIARSQGENPRQAGHRRLDRPGRRRRQVVLPEREDRRRPLDHRHQVLGNEVRPGPW
ncbi:hypothetical protein ACRAWF_20410 [Streptomyces sp. L7]